MVRHGPLSQRAGAGGLRVGALHCRTALSCGEARARTQVVALLCRGCAVRKLLAQALHRCLPLLRFEVKAVPLPNKGSLAG